MKKVLLFLVLFAAGLSVLRWIEEPIDQNATRPEVQGPPRAVRAEPAGVPEPPKPAPPEPGGDTVAEEESAGPAGASLSLRGAFSSTSDDGRYDLTAADSRTVGNAVELFDLTARVRDLETGEEVLRIRARQGRGTLVQSEGTGLGKLGGRLADEIVLEDVEATLLADAPVVPLALRAPDLRGVLGTGQFRTDSRVEISGKGLVASGDGFELFVDRGFMHFLRNGSAEVEVESGRRAALSCEGELAIESPPDRRRRLTLDAKENARVALAGREEFELEAEHVRVSGRPRSAGSEPFGFDRIDAARDVRLATPTSEFTADRAEIELEGSATRFEALLVGSPAGRLELAGDREDALVGLAASDPFSVTFSGEGPLRVKRTDALAFDLPGPAELDWKGARLTARESIQGRFGPVADEALFVAHGDIVIARADGSLETEEFRLRHERPPGGKARVTASATGPSRLVGDADPEHRFTLLTGERIDFVLEGETWRVPRAVGVDLTVEGPQGFVAKAAEVTEFAVAPLGLEASGDVALDSPDGELRGARLTVKGPEHTIVEGEPGRPAHFRSPRGEWVADRVERSGDLVIAENVERASFEHEDGEHEVSCRRLLLATERTVDADGATVESLRFTARDDVRARALREGNEVALSCDDLEGVLTEHSRDGAFLWSGSTLTATGHIRADVTQGDIAYELASQRLFVERTDRAAEELSSVRLTAQGEVVVESSGETHIRGEGDELEVDKLGRGRLTAVGDGRVRAEGVLPGDASRLFVMTGRWIQFSDSFLAASEPEADFWATGDALSREEAFHMRGRAERLEAELDRVSFLGKVRLESVDEGPQTWILSADRASLEWLKTADDNLLAGLAASGDVAFRWSTSLVAYGEEFSGRAEQRTVRIVGNPARVYHQGFVWQGKEFEYDLVVHVLSGVDMKIGPWFDDR